MAWRELRRCASTPALRYQFFGSSHDALEQGQMDTLDLLLIREGGGCASSPRPSASIPRPQPELSSASSTTVWRSVGRAPTTGASCSCSRAPRASAGTRPSSRRRVDAVCRILSAFDADERAQLAGLLGRFVDAFDDLVDELAVRARRPGRNRDWWTERRRARSMVGRPRTGRGGQIGSPLVASSDTFAEQAMRVRAAALLGCAAHDPQPGRRRRPRAGDVPPRVPRLPHVPGGHQPAGVVVPHPDQRLHQQVPRQAAPPDRDRSRRRRRPVPVPADRVARDVGGGAARAEDQFFDLFTDDEVKAGARGSAGELPAARDPRRCRGFQLQGDRRDARHPDRNGHVAAAPGKKSDAAARCTTLPRRVACRTHS